MAPQTEEMLMMQISPSGSFTPIALSWATEGSGKLYAECSKTFLHFTTDADRLIKSAAIRSASADAVHKIRLRQNFSSLSRTSSGVYGVASSGESDGDNIPRKTPKLSSKYLSDPEANQMRESDTSEDADHVIQMALSDWCSSEDISYMSLSEVTHDSVFETSPRIQDNGLPEVPPGLWDSQWEDPVSKSKKAKSKNRKRAAASLRSSGPFTTLMVRGLPCSLTQEALLGRIDRSGFEGQYDFFYLPRCGNSISNLGYAFINFKSSSYAQSFQMMFDGLLLNPKNSEKVCSVCPADLQGMPQLRKHFRRTAVSRGSRAPLFLKCNALDSHHDTHQAPDRKSVV